jgi:hypothetical protein
VLCYIECMTNDDARARVSKTTTVRLDDLYLSVAAAARAAGVGPSTWLRNLALRELEALGQLGASEASDAGESTSSVYRAWLNADLTAQLDVRRQRDGFRSRAAVLRALIAGVGITGAGEPVDAGVEGAAGPSEAPATLRQAVDALGASNHQLVAIVQGVNSVAKSLREADGVPRVIDRIRLDETVVAIGSHLRVASQLLGDLRPLLKSAAKK